MQTSPDVPLNQFPEARQKALQSILNKTADNKKIFGTSFAIKKDAMRWSGASGNLSIGQPHFIASTTKLFTTALIMQLRAAGKLNIDDPIGKYFNPLLLFGLHRYKGKDYSSELSIRQLLAHTSGLPDYFMDKGPSGKNFMQELINGRDQLLGFDQIIKRTKHSAPLFAPGTHGKAHYSDTNFQLLGKIIEVITGYTYANQCDEQIIRPLSMKSTYLYSDESDTTPAQMFYKSRPLIIPRAMVSAGADGGMVSTSGDMLIFIEAFFSGQLFPKEYLAEMQVWNKIFFPFRSGIGLHLFKLPWLFNPTGAVPAFIGHSGLSGALAYWSPKENIYVAGTVNQVAYPDRSFRTMIKLVLQIMKEQTAG